MRRGTAARSRGRGRCRRPRAPWSEGRVPPPVLNQAVDVDAAKLGPLSRSSQHPVQGGVPRRAGRVRSDTRGSPSTSATEAPRAARTRPASAPAAEADGAALDVSRPSRHDHAAVATRTATATTKNSGWARPPPARSNAAATVPRRVRRARQAAAARKAATSARLARYPPPRNVVQAPASTAPASHASRGPSPRPRASAAAASALAGINAYCTPATAGTNPIPSALATVGISAGVPGRSPTRDSPSAAPTRDHQR